MQMQTWEAAFTWIAILDRLAEKAAASWVFQKPDAQIEAEVQQVVDLLVICPVPCPAGFDPRTAEREIALGLVSRQVWKLMDELGIERRSQLEMVCSIPAPMPEHDELRALRSL